MLFARITSLLALRNNIDGLITCKRLSIVADALEYCMQVNCSLKRSLLFPQSKCPCEWKFLAAEIATAYLRSKIASTKESHFKEAYYTFKKEGHVYVNFWYLDNIIIIRHCEAVILYDGSIQTSQL